MNIPRVVPTSICSPMSLQQLMHFLCPSRRTRALVVRDDVEALPEGFLDAVLVAFCAGQGVDSLTISIGQKRRDRYWSRQHRKQLFQAGTRRPMNSMAALQIGLLRRVSAAEQVGELGWRQTKRIQDKRGQARL